MALPCMSGIKTGWCEWHLGLGVGVWSGIMVCEVRVTAWKESAVGQTKGHIGLIPAHAPHTLHTGSFVWAKSTSMMEHNHPRLTVGKEALNSNCKGHDTLTYSEKCIPSHSAAADTGDLGATVMFTVKALKQVI